MHLPFLEEELEGVFQPWEEHPYQLASWFDVLNFSAEAFYWFGRALRDIRCDCYIGSVECIDGEPGFAMMRPLDDKARDKALTSLAYVESQSRKIGMQITAETVAELIEKVKAERKHNFQWLFDQTETIEGLARKELRGKAFFYIPPERMKFWPKEKEPFAFGKAVSTSFPSTNFDASNAATCLATTHSTASVFHLMRVLEIGLAALGKEFEISLEHTNWQPALDQIEKKIREMPHDAKWRARTDFKEQQEFYAQTASHFAILKDAWRNHTMHVRGKYTQDEAELIFENVKAFMQRLAERLAEDELIPYGKP